MKLRIVAIGTRLPSWADAGVAEFLKRFPREFPVKLEAIAPSPRRSGDTPQALQAADSERLRARLGGGERVVVLDERGTALSTAALAERIEAWQHDGRDVALLIGGADGHSPGLRAQADELVSLSALTLPHALARLLLVEQLYRAYTLLIGHPYHRA